MSSCMAQVICQAAGRYAVHILGTSDLSEYAIRVGISVSREYLNTACKQLLWGGITIQSRNFLE